MYKSTIRNIGPFRNSIQIRGNLSWWFDFLGKKSKAFPLICTHIPIPIEIFKKGPRQTDGSHYAFYMTKEFKAGKTQQVKTAVKHGCQLMDGCTRRKVKFCIELWQFVSYATYATLVTYLYYSGLPINTLRLNIASHGIHWLNCTFSRYLPKMTRSFQHVIKNTLLVLHFIQLKSSLSFESCKSELT